MKFKALLVCHVTLCDTPGRATIGFGFQEGWREGGRERERPPWERRTVKHWNDALCMVKCYCDDDDDDSIFLYIKHNVQSVAVPTRTGLTSGASIATFIPALNNLFCVFIFLSATWTVVDVVWIHKKGEKNLYFHCSTLPLIDVLSCLDWKPKSVHLDVIRIIHTVVFLFSWYFSFFFLKLGGIWRRRKKNTQAFQFLQLVVHMYFVPVKLFILEIKEKSLYWKKKNCLASQCGLALTGSRVRPLGSVKQFKIRKKKQKKRKTHLVFVSEGCPTFTWVGSLRVRGFGEGLGSSNRW